MGLDMYLIQRKSIGKADIKVDAEILTNKYDWLKDAPKAGAKYENVFEISMYVCKWRKANAIHRWFVENVQNGVDDCDEYDVTQEQLHSLLDTCKEVLETKNYSLLPTLAGFFFGSIEYDEEYISDLEYTVERLEAILADAAADDDFYYSSSW